MSATPTAISQDTVRLGLVYISQALPLPTHLLSRPLLHRHYFLNIGPDNYISYLAWPGSSSHHLAQVLSGFSLPSDDQHVSYPVVYTSDPDAILAHVCVASARPTSDSHIRLVFLWDSSDATWKYHNLSLMPFPQDSVSSIDRLLSQTSFDQSNMDTASYWGPSDQSDIGSDDDYWARYSATAQDSALSSPSRTQDVGRQTTLSEESERIMVSYPATQVEPYNPLEPPSAEQLAHRLATLSAESRKTQLDDSVPYETGSDSPTLSPNQLQPSDLADSTSTKPALVSAAEHDTLVGDAIRAIYRLWSSTKPEGHNQEAFMKIVRQSIHTS